MHPIRAAKETKKKITLSRPIFALQKDPKGTREKEA